MRQLLPAPDDHPDLEALLAFPAGPWCRALFVSTVDGAGNGRDGRTGSINNAADKAVYDIQRTLCDAVLAGAGTVETEKYERIKGDTPLVIISNTARLSKRIGPPASGRGPAILVTCSGAGSKRIDSAREVLGDDFVWVLGDHEVDLRATVAALRVQGMEHILCEGGPHLFSSLLVADLVDDLSLTVVPRMVGKRGSTRITAGAKFDLVAEPSVLLEEDGTLIALYAIRR